MMPPVWGQPMSAAAKEELLLAVSDLIAPGRVEVFRRAGTPVVMGRRAGYRFWDVDGRELIDIHINGGVFNLGHRNAELIEALIGGLESYDIGNHHFPSVPRLELARRLAELTPGDLRYAVFTPSGGEANDVAIKTARRATGRRRIAGIAGGFHGASGLSGAAGDPASARDFLSDDPDGFAIVAFNDLDALRACLSSGDVAAVILETIPATLGFPLPEPGYLAGVRALCDEFGTLYIADEVQTGMGRTGRLWGVEDAGVVPDILVAGKGLGGGLYPMAAAVLRPAVAGWLHDRGWGYVSSAGGSEIGCVVALKALEITTRPATIAHAKRLADQAAAGLAAIAANEPFLTEIRQRGLVIGLKTDHPNGGRYLSKALYDRGVWAFAAGFDPSVLQFKPGLLLDAGTLDIVLERLPEALKAVRERLARRP